MPRLRGFTYFMSALSLSWLPQCKYCIMYVKSRSKLNLTLWSLDRSYRKRHRVKFHCRRWRTFETVPTQFPSHDLAIMFCLVVRIRFWNYRLVTYRILRISTSKTPNSLDNFNKLGSNEVFYGKVVTTIAIDRYHWSIGMVITTFYTSKFEIIIN